MNRFDDEQLAAARAAAVSTAQPPVPESSAADPMAVATTAYDAIAEFNLAAHPEGGWYRRTYTAAAAVVTPAGERPAVTLIHFWLRRGEESKWHVVASDEIWLWHGPGPLTIEFGGSGEEPADVTTAHVLAGPGTPGAVQQVLVPAGVWQRTAPVSCEVLVSCMVTPGFDFADWRLARAR